MNSKSKDTWYNVLIQLFNTSSVDKLANSKFARTKLSSAVFLLAKAIVKVYSIQGKEVLKKSIESTGFSTIKLPKLSKGIYVVNIDSKTIQLSKKIIIN